ncbi:glycosyltransferase family 4 protein [Candidatus Saccharibacteria bacterium]|nr:glycosyltransferase family 4 protein [Candidatus Saccharibacteria bacterium]
MRICIIGHFGGKKNFTDGQTVKTKEVYDFLVKNGMTVNAIDTFLLKRNPLGILSDIKRGVANSDATILMVSSRGYKLIAKVLLKNGKHCHKKVFDFVIGGARFKLFDKHPSLKETAKAFTKIYVETERMKKEYEKRGVMNVDIIPNFKSLKLYPPKNSYIKSKEFVGCIFSRIIKEKGISDAIDAIRLVNDRHDGIEYKLDIYGRISKEYSKEFSALLEANKQSVRYMGEVNSSDSSRIINKYDVLLFPTYWKGEGFPGTLLDSFFASTPVIASDWNDNFSILEAGKNSIMAEVRKPGSIADAMSLLANDERTLVEMSKNAHDAALKYMPDIAMKPFMDDLKENN